MGDTMNVPIEDKSVLINKSEFDNYQNALNDDNFIRMKKLYLDNIIYQTDKAYLVEKNSNRFWIPKSVTYNLDLEKPTTVYVPYWFTLENNIVTKHKCSKLRDLNGILIYEKDTLIHPDGLTGIVVYKNNNWFVKYGDSEALSQLVLQIGEKGQAVVVRNFK